MYSMLSTSTASLLLLLLPLVSCQWGPPHYTHTAPPAPAHPSTSVPQDTPEVAAAKAAHFAAVAKAAAAASAQVTYAPASAYGPATAAQPAPPAPPPVNGVPQDTPEVAAAKAAHFAALAKVAGQRPAPAPHSPAPYNPGPYGPPAPYPQGPSSKYPPAPPPVNGVPQDTPEVAAAKAAHFAAVARTGGPSPPPSPASYYPPAPSPPSYYPPAPTPAPYYPPAPTPAPYYSPPAHQYTPAPAPSGVPQDTPEVAAAKAAHFAALARVKSAPQPPAHNHWN